MLALLFLFVTLTTTAAAAAADAGCACRIVIDVRSQSEWDVGHVSCAHRLPVQDDRALVSSVRSLANGNMATPLAVYCASGPRAEAASKILRTDGPFTAVTNVGGYNVALEKYCVCNSLLAKDGGGQLCTMEGRAPSVGPSLALAGALALASLLWDRLAPQ